MFKEENEGRREKQVKEIRQGQELQKDVCTLHHPLKSPTEYPECKEQWRRRSSMSSEAGKVDDNKRSCRRGHIHC
ncbi:unnamed protein product, partial [Vitis vinifera]|uniref:Uncharacterized protein n=1 Tax=Vitis vinifera TaxID=29760 RepID=D7T1F2_VITVI